MTNPTRGAHSLRGIAAAAVCASAVLTACSTASAVAPPTTTSNVVLAAVLDSALQDERHAEHIYLRVLADHGNVLPFFNVVIAEQRHSTSIEALLRTRGLPVPENPWTLDNVPRFTSVAAACTAAAAAEVANVALYDRFLTQALPADVQLVFAANRRASVQNHLPAFERCR
jgi:hypothetical protein